MSVFLSSSTILDFGGPKNERIDFITSIRVE